MRFGMGTRRAALDGLTRILEAGALEDLFTGPDEDAVFMYDLLVEVTRGRSSECYWEICRTARRRGITPEYVIDRAAVLLASIDERRRIDAYRILGVQGMASPEVIRHRWLEFAKTGHPDVGGDTARFRRVKEAYELLRDPQRRSEYERYWLRALGPFERVVPRDPDVEATVRREPVPERRLAMVAKRGALVDGSPPMPAAPVMDEVPTETEPPARVETESPVVAATVGDAPREEIVTAEPVGLAHALGRMRDLVRQIDAAELADARARLARQVESLESLHAQLTRLLAVKRAIRV
jgi:hypothetical protein